MEDELKVKDVTTIAHESSIKIWSDLRRTLPEVAKVLEVPVEDLKIIDYFSFPNEYMSSNLRDQPFHTMGHINGLPFIHTDRIHARGPMGFGTVFFTNHYTDPNGETREIKYAIFIQKDQWGEESYLIVPKKKLYPLVRNAWRLTRNVHTTITPPVLAEGILEDVVTSTVGFLKHGREIKKYGVAVKRGILLDGPPGNGKTMLCRYIQKLCSKQGVRWGTVTTAEIDKAYADRQLTSLFNRFTVTFFDDIDVGYMNRAKGNGRMACAMLTAMDGVIEQNNLVRIFTTNEPLDELDPAFTRPGRIDRTISIGKPTKEMREKLVRNHWPKEIVDNIDVDFLLDETNDFSFAEVEAIRSFLVTNKVVCGKGWNLDLAFTNFDERQKEQVENVGFMKGTKKRRKSKREAPYVEAAEPDEQPWDEVKDDNNPGWHRN